MSTLVLGLATLLILVSNSTLCQGATLRGIGGKRTQFTTYISASLFIDYLNRVLLWGGLDWVTLQCGGHDYVRVISPVLDMDVLGSPYLLMLLRAQVTL